jgi:predicted enzyme related to lactoylglutathione lyase
VGVLPVSEDGNDSFEARLWTRRQRPWRIAMTTQLPGSLLGPIGQIAVNVEDIDRAVAFYRDVLGLPFLFQGGPTLAFFNASGVRLMLDVAEKEEFRHPSSILYFTVEAIRDVHRTLAQRGVRFEGEPHVVHKAPGYELWMAFFRDSENNLLALMEEVR